MANNLDHKKKLLIALRRKEVLARQVCFNPRDFNSKPTAVQKEAVEDVNNLS